MDNRIKNLCITGKRYLRLPLYLVNDDKILRLTLDDIVEMAQQSGFKSIEYYVQRDLYAGYNGDNISLYTGKYYLLSDISGSTDYIEVDGAPSYLDELRKRLPGFTIVFTEGLRFNHTCLCTLRIEKIVGDLILIG
jgi:hypothetical protein